MSQYARAANRPIPAALELAARAIAHERAGATLEALVRDGAGMEAVRAAQARADLAEQRLHAALATAVPGYEPGDLQRALDAEVQHLLDEVLDHPGGTAR